MVSEDDNFCRGCGLNLTATPSPTTDHEVEEKEVADKKPKRKLKGAKRKGS
jgi:hypothetical protein